MDEKRGHGGMPVVSVHTRRRHERTCSRTAIDVGAAENSVGGGAERYGKRKKNCFKIRDLLADQRCTHSILDCMRTMRVRRRVGPRVAPPPAGEDRTEDGDAGNGKARNWKERRTRNRKRSRRWQRSIFLGS